MSADITVRRGDIDCDTHTVEVDMPILTSRWSSRTLVMNPSEAADLAEALAEVAAPPPLCQRPAGTLRGPYGRSEACEHFAVAADDSCRCHGGGGGL